MVNKKIHKNILKILAIFLLILVFINILIHLFYYGNEFTEILWYCNLASIILSIGILYKKNLFISLVLITTPAQFFWIYDFIITSIGINGLGRTSWLFELPLPIFLFSSIFHFLLIPISIYATLIYGFNKKSFFGGIIFILFSIFVPYYFTSFEDNINCVFYPCDLSFEKISMGVTIPTMFGHYVNFGSYFYLFFITLRWILFLALSYFLCFLLFKKFLKK
jgi:hypothetical protein